MITVEPIDRLHEVRPSQCGYETHILVA